MTDYTEYATRMAERYSVLRGAGPERAKLPDAYEPQVVRRGPRYAVRELPRAEQALKAARGRAREPQIRELLAQQPYLDLLLDAPSGADTALSTVLTAERRVVLLGQAGAGKSTALQYLALHPLSVGERELLTMIVDLAAFAPATQSLTEYLVQDARILDLELPEAFFVQALENGQAVVCLDGLDQIPTQADRTKAVEAIESLVARYPRARFVVTARSTAYEPHLDRTLFSVHVLSPWSTTVVSDLEAAWAEASADLSEEEAAAQLATAPRLLQDIVAAREVVARFGRTRLNPGWKVIREHLWEASWRERILLIFRFLSQDRPELWGRVMSLVLEAGARDDYEGGTHRHLLLAAQALARSDENAGLDQSVVDEVVDGLFAWLSDARAVGRYDAMGALRELTQLPGVAQRALELAANAEADAWAREAAVLVVAHTPVSDAIDPVLEVLGGRIDDAEEHLSVRQAACTALGYMAAAGCAGEEERNRVVERLLAAAQDAEVSIEVRQASTEALGTVLLAAQDEAILQALVPLARGEGEAHVPYAVQVAAGHAIAGFAAEEQDPAVIELAWEMARASQVDEGVRIALSEVLGKISDPAEAAQILIEIGRSPDIYPPGRRQALEALGRLGYSDDGIVEALTTIAQTKERKTKDFERLAAAKALSEIGHLDLSLQHLLMLIADKSIYRSTRNDALSVLGETGLSGDEDLDAASVAVLMVWVSEENTTEDVREQAMESLVMLRVASDDVVRGLISVAQDRTAYPRVRRAAVGALARLPVEQKELVVEGIEVPFYDSEEKSDLLRVPIARLLVLWGDDPRARDYLRAAAEQSYMALVRYGAGVVLHELGHDDTAVPTLLKLATDSGIADPIRCDSLRALSLWRVGDTELAEQLKSILDEEEPMPNVPEAAYAALRTMLTA